MPTKSSGLEFLDNSQVEQHAGHHYHNQRFSNRRQGKTLKIRNPPTNLQESLKHPCQRLLMQVLREVRLSQTVAPLLVTICATVPSLGATISFSIFIASSMSRIWPAFTAWPAVTSIRRMLPGIGAAMVSPLATGAGCGSCGSGSWRRSGGWSRSRGRGGCRSWGRGRSWAGAPPGPSIITRGAPVSTVAPPCW